MPSTSPPSRSASSALPADVTREAVLRHLREGPAAAPDLAAHLDISGTAVRKHLDHLRLEGLVEEAGIRRGRGRPATLYGLTGRGEAHFQRDRGEILETVLAAVHAAAGPEDARRLLRDAGARLARRMMAEEGTRRAAVEWDDPVDRALHMLHELGGRDSVRRTEEGVEILGFVCPLGEYVRSYPETCHLVAGFTSEVLGRPVTPACSRDEPDRGRDDPMCVLAAGAPPDGS